MGAMKGTTRWKPEDCDSLAKTRLYKACESCSNAGVKQVLIFVWRGGFGIHQDFYIII